MSKVHGALGSRRGSLVISGPESAYCDPPMLQSLVRHFFPSFHSGTVTQAEDPEVPQALETVTEGVGRTGAEEFVFALRRARDSIFVTALCFFSLPYEPSHRFAIDELTICAQHTHKHPQGADWTVFMMKNVADDRS